MIEPSTISNTHFDRWRAKLTTKLLRIYAIIAAPIMVYAAINDPLMSWFYFAIIYFVVLVFALTPLGGVKLRIGFIVGSLMLAGVLIILNFGVVSGGRLYLGASVILSVVLLGQKAGLLFFALSIIEICTIAFLSLSGLLPQEFISDPLSGKVGWWVWFVLSYFLCVAISQYAVMYLIKRLEKNFADLQSTVSEKEGYLLAERESSERYKLLAENVSDVIWTLDLDLNYTYLSPSVFKSRGYTPEELMEIGPGENFTAIPMDDMRKLLAENLAADTGTASSDQTLRLETKIRHKDGHWLDTELVINFLRDGNGVIEGILGVSRDISSHKVFEQALDSVLNATKHKQGADYFDSLVENLQEALAYDIVFIGKVVDHSIVSTLAVFLQGNKVDNFDYDLDGTPCDEVGRDGICTYPKNVQALFPNDVLLVDMGMDSYLGVSIKDDNGAVKGIVVAMHSKEMVDFQLGEKLLTIFASHVNSEFLRKEKEHEKEYIRQQLLHAQKIESIGQLSGGIAHDFNNLLVVINGYVDLAMEHKELGPEMDEYLTEIKGASDRATELTSQLLSFSRRHIMEFKPLNFNDLVGGLSGLLARLLPENIHYSYIPGAELGTINGDSGQLEQAIVNLAVNARDAMPDGGNLTIETENILIDQSYVDTHPWTNIGRYVLVRVSDTGMGIASEMQERIYEPFFTTKPEGKGTGLGLSVYFGIVKQHGGFSHLYSEEGRGSEFRTYLPIVERSASSLERKTEANLVRGEGTILLVEDDPQVSKLGLTILTRAGYKVITAEDGELALERFGEHHEELDLVLLDVVLPKLDGRQVMENIQKIDASIPILFVSGYSSNGIHTNFILEDDLVLLQKPYSAESLLRKVANMISEPQGR